MVASKGGHEPPEPGRQPADEVTKRAELARGVGAYLIIPTMMGVGPVLGFLIGSWFEKRYGHAPWLSFAGVVFGAAASVRQIIKILQATKTTGANDRRRDDGP